VSTQNRIQPGVREGGQFTTGARAESDVALAPTSGDYDHVVDHVHNQFAGALGVEPDQVEVEVKDVGVCGLSAEARPVTMSAPLPGSTTGQDVTVSVVVFPGGSTRDLRVSIGWEDPGDSTMRQSVGTSYGSTRTIEELPQVLEKVKDQAAVQVELDKTVNQPQRERDPRHDYSGTLYASALHPEHGGREVQFSSGPGQADAITVAFDTGNNLNHVRLGTKFGEITVGNQDEEKVLRRMDGELTFGLGEDYSAKAPNLGRASFAERMARILPPRQEGT